MQGRANHSDEEEECGRVTAAGSWFLRRAGHCSLPSSPADLAKLADCSLPLYSLPELEVCETIGWNKRRPKSGKSSGALLFPPPFSCPTRTGIYHRVEGRLTLLHRGTPAGIRRILAQTAAPIPLRRSPSCARFVGVSPRESYSVSPLVALPTSRRAGLP